MEIDLNIDVAVVRRKLASFLRTEIAAMGYHKAVVGLSGGIDSALACTLAAEALGPQNVLAVRMPYRTSSPSSLSDAQLVIEKTGVQSLTIEITPMAEPLIGRFPEMSPVRRGNIMARVRMIVLYDQSAAFKGVVVGTGNKTEAMLGYTTLYGDSACALNPLGDLFKTQVRQLSAALGLPPSVISKPPSADLWQGQTDESEIGFSYAEMDRLLHLLVDRKFSPEQCVEAGFEAAFVQSVIERMRRNAFKRQLPPVAMLNLYP
jgi:NAD+ synthase